MITYLIVCPLLFLAGFVDSIGGGGGLISLPAYLFAGLPPHMAIATNKLSSSCGTTVATGRFLLHGLIDLKLALPSVLFAMAGSSIGAHISLLLEDAVIRHFMIFVLPVAAFFVLNRNLFREYSGEALVTRKTYLIAMLAAFVVGCYDGLYGPGTGTFLIIAFTVFAHMFMGTANAEAKVINLTTNYTALAVFLMNGQVLIPLGLTAGLFNMAGNYLGSGLAMKNGIRIVRPIILLVLGLLFIKILTGN